MSKKKISLRIVTPYSVKLAEQADMVIMRSVSGDMGILPGHTPFSVLLDYGILRILNGGSEKKLVIFGGVADIIDNSITILTEWAEREEEIDIDAARKVRAEAKELLKNTYDLSDVLKLKESLRESYLRIKAAPGEDYEDE